MSAIILLVEDDATTRDLITQYLESAPEGFCVKGVGSVRRALEYLAAHDVDCVLLDHGLPDGSGLKTLCRLRDLQADLPVILVTVQDDTSLSVEAMKGGAVDYVVKHGRFLPKLLQRVREALGGRDLQRALEAPKQSERPLGTEVLERYRAAGIIGDSPALREAIKAAERAAHTRATVLLHGETGTGKELFARAIHHRGPCATGAFIPVNCPAIPRELVESELFGHVKGAYTGATERRRGLFETADGGTIFLDEIADLDPAAQAKLLRVLETGEVHAVGADVTRHVRVRVIAATNRDLRYHCEQGRFREDLYHRLNALRITLPPLRERSSDVPLLFQHFVTRLAQDAAKPLGPIDPDLSKRLQACAWPGNVRQVRNEAERVVNTAERGERITLALLSPELRNGNGTADDERTLKEILRHVQAATITSRLRKYAYNRTLTAKSLGISRERLWSKIQDLGIEVPE